MNHAFAVALGGTLAVAACSNAAETDEECAGLQWRVAREPDVGADDVGPVPGESDDAVGQRHGGYRVLGPNGLRPRVLPVPGHEPGRRGGGVQRRNLPRWRDGLLPLWAAVRGA